MYLTKRKTYEGNIVTCWLRLSGPALCTISLSELDGPGQWLKSLLPVRVQILLLRSYNKDFNCSPSNDDQFRWTAERSLEPSISTEDHNERPMKETLLHVDLGFQGRRCVEFCCPNLMAVVNGWNLCSTFPAILRSVCPFDCRKDHSEGWGTKIAAKLRTEISTIAHADQDRTTNFILLHVFN